MSQPKQIPYKTIILLVVLLSCSILAQSNYLNNSAIYSFLDRQEIAGKIKINHHQKPYSRDQIATALQELLIIKSELTAVDQEKLQYYLSEYNISSIHPFIHSSSSGETQPLETKTNHWFLESNEFGAFRFYEYQDSTFNFTIYPDIGGSYTLQNNSRNKLFYYNGLSGYGNIGSHFSFDFKFNDFSINSNNIPVDNIFNAHRGFDYLRFLTSTETYNWDRTRAALTFSWDWGIVSLRKDYNYWGTGYNGKLILSDKAPSFPHIQLRLSPFEDIEFNYIHGELNSMVYDSSTYRMGLGTRDHIQLVPKYYAAHILSFNLFNDLKISIGESVTYSDRFEPIYLVPFLFFRMADHYLSKTDLNSGNAQVFSSISYRLPKIKTRLDASLFIDEISVSDIGGDLPTIVGYSFGITNYDILIDNVGLQVEYTRINPAVYQHGDVAQSYSNRGYFMGHWIGSNADQFYLNILINPLSQLNLNISYEYTRKGHFENSTENLREEGKDFLFGEKSYFSVFRFSASYELLNNLFIQSDVVISNSWGQNNVINVIDHKYQEATLGFRYGLD